MRFRLLLLSVLITTVALASAQSRYDDDIYYDASKDTKTKQENAAYKKAQAERKAREVREAEQQRLAEQDYYDRLYQLYYGNYDPERGGETYEAAGKQTIDGNGSTRDVDEYNRRGKYASSVTHQPDSLQETDDFAYTRRIERFHNNDIIAEANDPNLVDYYYSSQPEINVYYINDPWSRWGWNSWAWEPSYYSPYWGWNNYWSWNWNWNWGPSWSWGWNYPFWGWEPVWGWSYPSWGWGPIWGGPIYGGGSMAASRYTPNGRRPVGIRNGYTGLGGQRGQLNNGNHSANSRNNRYTLTPAQVGNYRPSNGSGTYRPSQSTVNNNRYPSVNHGSYSPNTTSGNRSGNRNTYNSSRNNSYNSGSYNSGSSSRGGWGGGGSVGGGGGGHRGGRR